MSAPTGIDPERRAAAAHRRQRVDRWLPFRRWMREAGAGSHRADVLAGLTVAAMLVPQGMAYAALAGMPPVTGLYASTVPLVVYALLGTSGQLAVGPVAIVSLLTASTLAPVADGDPATYVALAGLLAAMVGAIQLGLGLVRAGRLTTLLAHPVISGFTSAAAIVIATSQLDKLFGVSIGDVDGWIERVTAIAGALGDTNPATLILGVVAIVLLLGGKKLGSRVPTALIVVGLATLAVPLLDLQARGVATLGAVPAGFPLPQLPTAPLDAVVALLPGAVIIALLAYLEGISVARAIASRTGDRIDPDQELIASGAANLAASVVQAFPVAGGFSRTAVNHAAGARTPLATIVTAAGVLLALLLLAPAFTTLPQVVLAAVVLVAVIGLVDVREARHAWRVERTDGMVLIVTFLATLLLSVEIGIVIGIATSLAVSLWRVGRLRIAITRVDPATIEAHVEGDLLPASAVRLYDAVSEALGEAVAGVERLVLDLSCVPSADGSGVQALVSVDEVCRAAGVELHLRAPTAGVMAPLERAGLTTRFAGRILDHRPHDQRVPEPS
jgi:sulfate permease, SulP family